MKGRVMSRLGQWVRDVTRSVTLYFGDLRLVAKTPTPSDTETRGLPPLLGVKAASMRSASAPKRKPAAKRKAKARAKH